ncbi:MAG: shikimate dehydrogenase [Alsobacter sp.]
MSRSASPPRACVIGHPIRHSRSPLIHGHWLSAYGLQGSYDKVDVAPGDLAAFLRAMPEQGYVGCNVTVPHKEAAFALVDAATDRARMLGAVNTLWFERGRLHGDNTDVLGFLSHADASVPHWDREVGCALVLGAGGAARGVVAGLLERGVGRVVVANRTSARAAALAAQFDSRVEPHGWDGLRPLLGAADLLVNTTSLGMQGQPPLAVDLSPMKPDAIVDDIVYVPLETDLLRQARQHGLRTIDGLGMLLHQAAPGFEHWFGRRPEVTPALRALIEADILGHSR